MLGRSAWGEVVNNGLEHRKRCGAEGPDIRSVGFLLAWRKHLNRRLIGVDNVLGQHRFAQCIDQRLEMHTSLSNPLRQRRACKCQTGAAKDFLLPIAASDQRTSPPSGELVGLRSDALSITCAGTGA
jgi:hypothetical protein